MSETGTLDILKRAILLERRGRSFYQKVADQSDQPAVKDFFEMMAKEEERHIQVLADQYKAYQKDSRFVPEQLEEERASEVASRVLSQELKEQIAAAGFEAAAVAAAMSMEERAIRLYADRAESAEDPAEKSLYKWLADWEREHLHFLSDIDREVTEKVWMDNSFWPF